MYIMTNADGAGSRYLRGLGISVWGLFFDVTRLIIGVTQVPYALNNLRAGDNIPRGCRGSAIAGLIIVVTGVVGMVLEESDSND
jgi:hypothetical protein